MNEVVGRNEGTAEGCACQISIQNINNETISGHEMRSVHTSSVKHLQAFLLSVSNGEYTNNCTRPQEA